MLERLRQFREKAGISQRALAEVIGVSQQSINKYENHNIEPDIRTLMLLAEYFNTSVDYLIGYSDIDHRLEAIKAEDLNGEELELVQGYRRLTKKQRQSLRLVMETFLE